MLKIKSKTPTPPPIEEEVVEEQPLEIKVYMDYIGEEGYVYKYNKEKGKYYKSSICLMGPKGNPGIRGPKGDPGAGADVDLSQYASKSYVDDKISNLINSAPEALDTLGELATKVGELMPLHGNTGDVDGFKLIYLNGDTEGIPIDISLLYAIYNDDSFMGKNSIIMVTASEEGGGMLLINNLTCLIGSNTSNIGCIGDDIRITTKNGNFVKIYSKNSLLRYPDEPEEGVEIEPYTILDTGNAKTINGQSLLWNGESESTKNIELVTKTELEETEEVIATALTDLDTRINNSIKSIKVNGTALTPDANKAVDISVPPGSFIYDIVIDPTSEDVTHNRGDGYMTITTTNLDVFTAIDNAYNEGKNMYVKVTINESSILCSFEGKETFDSNVAYRFNSFHMDDPHFGMYYLVFIDNSGLITIVLLAVNIPEKYKIINHGTNDTGTSNSPYQLTFGNMHVWGTVTSLNLSLLPSYTTDVVEYMFEFISGSTPTTLSLPNSIVWADSCGVLTVEANKRYLISIMNDIGVWCSVSTT